MISKITNSVNVSVRVEYDIKNSYPAENRFVFRYNISIENLRDTSIVLRKRRWYIYDVGHGYAEVTGDGVIGLMPEIKPGERFTYFSNVILKSGVGNMFGYYTLNDMSSGDKFEVEIPKFSLLSEVLCN